VGAVRRHVRDLGISYLMIRVAVREVSPSMLVLCRTVLAALLLLPLAARRGELAPLRSRLLPLAAFAGVEIATPGLRSAPPSSGCRAR
jgi:drug/metabolite transporter (DMT)-like permease